MRYTIIIIIIVGFIFSGCKKESFSTTPVLTYQSVNTKELLPDQIIKFNLSATDAEGDVTDTMFVQKVSFNCGVSNFSDRYRVPKFPTTANLKCDFVVSFSNGANNPGYYNIATCPLDRDTCYFRFMLKDKADNRSDTINSETIVIIK